MKEQTTPATGKLEAQPAMYERFYFEPIDDTTGVYWIVDSNYFGYRWTCGNDCQTEECTHKYWHYFFLAGSRIFEDEEKAMQAARRLYERIKDRTHLHFNQLIK